MRNAARHLTLGTLLTAIIWSPSLLLVAHSQAQTAAPSDAAPGPGNHDLKAAWNAAVARGFPDFVSALKAAPGCLGVEAARTQSGENVVVAWFENKQAVLNCYYSDVHQQLINGFSNGHRRPGGPLADVPAEGPILAIASVTIPPAPTNGDLRGATAQIAIELYAPLPGGLAAGGRFAPSTVKVPGLIEVPNSIAELTHNDPAAAERMTRQLASLMRSSLNGGGTPLVRLDEELKLVRDYLDIERVRFGDRLRFATEVDEGAGETRVPRLALQTLVENSVKYAVSPRRAGSCLAIRVSRHHDVTQLDVEDDGPGFEVSQVPAGHGLALLRSRLAMNFGERATLNIDSRPGRTCITVVVPTHRTDLYREGELAF